MYARISNPLKHFSIHIFPHATHPVSKEISLKGRLGTNSSKTSFKGMIKNFQKQLQKRGYPESFIQNTFSEVHFEERKLAFQQKRRENKRILPFVAQY